MRSIENLTLQEFHSLPLVVEGESKEVRYLGGGEVAIRLKPTIYSYTHNRAGVIDGSDTVRLQAIQSFMPVLEAAGVNHTYREVTDQWIRSELVLQRTTGDGSRPFMPQDLSPAEIDALPKAPPIEVIAKVRHTGTSKHRYYNLPATPTRWGTLIEEDSLYPETLIRFDWRNPMRHPANGVRLADEVLPEQMANWYINVLRARRLALRAFDTISGHMAKHDLSLWDICFFIDEKGSTLFGEVSPDCMRVRALGNTALDKDVWRAGGSSSEVLKKWQTMVAMLKTPERCDNTQDESLVLCNR